MVIFADDLLAAFSSLLFTEDPFELLPDLTTLTLGVSIILAGDLELDLDFDFDFLDLDLEDFDFEDLSDLIFTGSSLIIVVVTFSLGNPFSF